MIIARAIRMDDSKKELIILGLSAENVRRLQNGEDILLTRETHGEGIPEHLGISIIYGETEQKMADQLREMGAIGPDTKMQIDPRL